MHQTGQHCSPISVHTYTHTCPYQIPSRTEYDGIIYCMYTHTPHTYVPRYTHIPYHTHITLNTQPTITTPITHTCTTPHTHNKLPHHTQTTSPHTHVPHHTHTCTSPHTHVPHHTHHTNRVVTYTCCEGLLCLPNHL